jgi:hypothetical protein
MVDPVLEVGHDPVSRFPSLLALFTLTSFVLAFFHVQGNKERVVSLVVVGGHVRLLSQSFSKDLGKDFSAHELLVPPFKHFGLSVLSSLSGRGWQLVDLVGFHQILEGPGDETSLKLFNGQSAERVGLRVLVVPQSLRLGGHGGHVVSVWTSWDVKVLVRTFLSPVDLPCDVFLMSAHLRGQLLKDVLCGVQLLDVLDSSDGALVCVATVDVFVRSCQVLLRSAHIFSESLIGFLAVRLLYLSEL